MSGTVSGGKLAAKKNKEKFGEDFYKKIGAQGGKATNVPKGFASDLTGYDGLTGKQRASVAGKRGGKVSKRKKTPQTSTSMTPARRDYYQLKYKKPTLIDKLLGRK
jgi:general stress protein YciG